MTRRQTAMAIEQTAHLRGTVKALKRSEGYGFITHAATGQDFFFHKSPVDTNGDCGFDDLQIDQSVEFISVEAPKGPRAIQIRSFRRRTMDLLGIPEGDIAIAQQTVGQNVDDAGPSHPRRNRDASGNRRPTGEGRPAALARVARYRASHFTAGGEAVRRNGGDGS